MDKRQSRLACRTRVHDSIKSVAIGYTLLQSWVNLVGAADPSAWIGLAFLLLSGLRRLVRR
jgi:hypothetical protein